ncbi:HAD family phosphatase [uncultured Catenibacterium sp.]|uniref:HAD family hydrolase n=1 Tax=uncultured Catenibacterium sp. TaxID=286142 RepID=UPI0025E53CDB|nr:HAD family phosphatase [uncultured Catenibacterium sp.]
MKNIVFDLGRVLLSYEPLEWLKKKNYTHDNELFAIIFQNPLWVRLDEGTITREEFTEKLNNEYPELALDIETIMEEWIELLHPIENNIKLLSQLKEKGYSLYVISNFHLDAYERFLKKQDWFTLFDGAIISAKEKLIKPDLKIYELLLERYHLNADECLFIDDSLDNIKACKEIGMDGIHLPDNSKLEEELKKHQII